MSEIRKFDTGATRDTSTGKPDYCGFLSPEVLEEFGAYMHKHRLQADGTLRPANNWKKGIPREVYLESLFRHFLHLWLLHEGKEARDEKGNLVTMSDTLAALMFNVMGYFYEWLKAQRAKCKPAMETLDEFAAQYQRERGLLKEKRDAAKLEELKADYRQHLHANGLPGALASWEKPPQHPPIHPNA